MKPSSKIIVLIILGSLEIFFVSMVFSSVIPRRSADLEAFSKYSSSPTLENRDLWLKEHSKTLNEVSMVKSGALALALGNLALIGSITWKSRVPTMAP